MPLSLLGISVLMNGDPCHLSSPGGCLPSPTSFPNNAHFSHRMAKAALKYLLKRNSVQIFWGPAVHIPSLRMLELESCIFGGQDKGRGYFPLSGISETPLGYYFQVHEESQRVLLRMVRGRTREFHFFSLEKKGLRWDVTPTAMIKSHFPEALGHTVELQGSPAGP